MHRRINEAMHSLPIAIAEYVFDGVTFRVVQGIGKQTFEAEFRGYQYSDTSIVNLCRKLWTGNA